MKNRILLPDQNKQSELFYFPPLSWNEARGNNGVGPEEINSVNNELEQLYYEAQEYDFLKDNN